MIKLRLLTLGALVILAAASAAAQEPTLKCVEYFYDSDPGYGKATIINNVRQGSNDLQFSTAGLSCGSHLLCLRSQDSRGFWSATTSRSVFIFKIPPTATTVMEYFLDFDPGYGKGTMTTVTKGENALALDLQNVACGAHLLNMRVSDNAGNWTPVMARPIYVCKPRGFVALEYFFDSNDPGEGKAVQVAVPAAWDEAFAFDASVSGLSIGDHQLCVRAKDRNGVWSLLSIEPFNISQSSGIEKVEWTLPLTVRAEHSQCILSDNGEKMRGDCIVEIFNAAGTRMASERWKASVSQISIDVNASKSTVLLVKVTDRKNGRTVVKRIIMM